MGAIFSSYSSNAQYCVCWDEGKLMIPFSVCKSLRFVFLGFQKQVYMFSEVSWPHTWGIEVSLELNLLCLANRVLKSSLGMSVCVRRACEESMMWSHQWGSVPVCVVFGLLGWLEMCLAQHTNQSSRVAFTSHQTIIRCIYIRVIQCWAASSDATGMADVLVCVDNA